MGSDCESGTQRVGDTTGTGEVLEVQKTPLVWGKRYLLSMEVMSHHGPTKVGHRGGP